MKWASYHFMKKFGQKAIIWWEKWQQSVTLETDPGKKMTEYCNAVRCLKQFSLVLTEYSFSWWNILSQAQPAHAGAYRLQSTQTTLISSAQLARSQALTLTMTIDFFWNRLGTSLKVFQHAHSISALPFFRFSCFIGVLLMSPYSCWGVIVTRDHLLRTLSGYNPAK